MGDQSKIANNATPGVKINNLSPGDIRLVLEKGWHDFCKAPWFGLFFGLLYAGGGWMVLLLASASGFYFLAYPLAAGFALIAPFVAGGLYEVSRSLEAGKQPGWRQVLGIVAGAGSRDLGWMALITGFIFFIWMDIAFFLYAIFFGFRTVAPADLLTDIFTTWSGALFFLTGNLVGAAIAFFVFTITVVSFPLLLDRDVDFVSAMIASTRTVLRNPRTMILWALAIAVALLASMLTLLLGLVIILPVLGHASWHMYRRAVVPQA